MIPWIGPGAFRREYSEKHARKEPGGFIYYRIDRNTANGEGQDRPVPSRTPAVFPEKAYRNRSKRSRGTRQIGQASGGSFRAQR
jgi:hypothetical protein